MAVTVDLAAITVDSVVAIMLDLVARAVARAVDLVARAVAIVVD